MSNGLNRVMLLGHLGAEPELRSTSGSQAVLKLRLATTESYQDRNRQRQERTEWHSVVVWGKRAEALSRLLQKGSRIFVDGGLRTTSYDDRDGNKRYRTEIVASNVILCGARGAGGGREESEPTGATGGAAPASGGGFDDADYGGDRDDDFPF